MLFAFLQTVRQVFCRAFALQLRLPPPIFPLPLPVPRSFSFACTARSAAALVRGPCSPAPAAPTPAEAQPPCRILSPGCRSALQTPGSLSGHEAAAVAAQAGEGELPPQPWPEQLYSPLCTPAGRGTWNTHLAQRTRRELTPQQELPPLCTPWQIFKASRNCTTCFFLMHFGISAFNNLHQRENNNPEASTDRVEAKPDPK